MLPKAGHYNIMCPLLLFLILLLLEDNPCHARTVIQYPKIFLLIENTHTHAIIIIVDVIIIITSATS